jgi:hypothetical protein
MSILVELSSRLELREKEFLLCRSPLVCTGIQITPPLKPQNQANMACFVVRKQCLPSRA